MDGMSHARMHSSLMVIITGVVILVYLCTPAQGILVFREPLHLPRIYTGAPAGVHVTTIHAYDPDSPRNQVTYNLLDVRDKAFFHIDHLSGNLTTASTIPKLPDSTYHVIVVALSHGTSQLQQLEVSVTEFNRYPPVFEQPVYRSELHVNTSVGSSILRISAQDSDPLSYNAEVYYRLGQDPSVSFFDLDERTGEILLSQPLDLQPGVLTFGVFAEDGGSPKRWARARVEIEIKSISEPLDVQATNSTDTTVQVCWSRPNHGQVQGYVIKYREGGQDAENSRAHIVNITSNASSKCAVVSRLKPWTDYQYRVYAWNAQEIGIASPMATMATRPNYCHRNICKRGKCHPLNEEPGYSCDCEFGYYGSTCDLFDPCSNNPCENFGSCRNTSHNEYTCDCVSGFSGPNCTVFNPCAIRPSPCLNGASCDSTFSHTYNCLCLPGYFGKTCQRFDPCVSSPCKNAGHCFNVSDSDYTCACRPGYRGRHCEMNIDECLSSPCQNGGTCRDNTDSYSCSCPPGYQGTVCQEPIQCPTEITSSERGIFTWFASDHGQTAKATCPFGHHLNAGSTVAKRRCKLQPNGEVSWGKVNDLSCREEAFRSAEMMTEKLELMTDDPKNLSLPQIREAVEQIVDVVEFALRDEKIATGMFNVISNVLAVNESVLEDGASEQLLNHIVKVVDRFTSEIPIAKGESIVVETDNIALKAVAWDPDNNQDDSLVFTPASNKRFRGNVNSVEREEEMTTDFPSITLPIEAVLLAQKQLEDDVRLMFVSYKNDKLFRNKNVIRKETMTCSDNGNNYQLHERSVFQASIQGVNIRNLTEPIMYTLRNPPCIKAVCVFWNPIAKNWETDGVTTNQSGNVTTCFSTHLTAFSILLDPTPDFIISEKHKLPLSIISYIGCGLSILGLLLTLLTYMLFRCLNRDRSGKILLNLCFSMLLMNVAFLVGSQQGTKILGVDVCVCSAVLIHYFLLTSLAWMCVEAVNMYQLLIHVFASSESRFMLKRCVIGWGAPLIIVSVTVSLHTEEYFGKNEYCMLSATNPYVYYISFLGPSCLILLVNCTVFLMVARVLFTPRLASKPGMRRTSNSNPVVTLAQVRGAFTVMVLLGVTWVFGALAIGEVKVVFQYVFCVANSLQGFLIFIVRCLYYPEARNAWAQLCRNGTLKKYRGMGPPGGSWYANSSSNQKHNGHARTVRVGSTSSDSTSTVVFNSNYWCRQSQVRDSQNRLTRLSSVTSLLKTANNVNPDTGWARRTSSCKTFGHPAPRPNMGRPPQLDRLGATNNIITVTCPTILTVKEHSELPRLPSNHFPPVVATKNLDQLSTIGYIDEDVSSEQYRSVIMLNGSPVIADKDGGNKNEFAAPVEEGNSSNIAESMSDPDETTSYTRRLTLPLVKEQKTCCEDDANCHSCSEDSNHTKDIEDNSPVRERWNRSVSPTLVTL